MIKRRLEEKIERGQRIGGTLLLESNDETFSLTGSLYRDDGNIVVETVVVPENALYTTFRRGISLFLNGVFQEPQALGPVAAFRTSLGVATLLEVGNPVVAEFVSGAPLEVKFYPRYTVLQSVAHKLREPTLARSRINGLAHWMHDSYIARPIDMDNGDDPEDPQTSNVSISTRDFTPVVFAFEDFTIRISSDPEMIRDRTQDLVGLAFHPMATVEFDNGAGWGDLLDSLHEIQDLVMLLCWRNLRPSLLSMVFEPGLPGIETIDRWSRVFTSRFEGPRKTDVDQRLDFVMRFSSLKAESVAIWLLKRSEHAHAMSLFLQVIGSPSMSHEVRALQLGAGIEALGFKLAARQVGADKADKLRAEKLFRTVAIPAVELFPDAFASWARDANECYQAMKHLNRDRVPTGFVAETNDRSTLVIQIWLATLLGASEEEIVDYVENCSRFRSNYRKLSDPSQYAPS